MVLNAARVAHNRMSYDVRSRVKDRQQRKHDLHKI